MPTFFFLELCRQEMCPRSSVPFWEKHFVVSGRTGDNGSMLLNIKRGPSCIGRGTPFTSRICPLVYVWGSSISFYIGCHPIRLSWSNNFFWTPTKIAGSPLGASWIWSLTYQPVHRSPGTYCHCPAYLHNSKPIIISCHVHQSVWGFVVLLRSLVFLLVKLNSPPCVVCSQWYFH